MMEWTKSYTLRLIELWHSKPCLWQVNHPDYKSKTKRKEAVAEISVELGTSELAIEKRLISLRTQYSRALLKCKGKSGDGEEDSGWYAFDKLHFIKDNPQEPLNKPALTICMNRKRHSSSEVIQAVSLKQIPPPVKKRFQIEHQQGTTLEVAPDKNPTKITKDKFSAFGELVAAELRSIHEEKYIVMLKKRITDVIYDFKLDMLSNSNNAYDPIAFKGSPASNQLYFPDIQHS